MTLLQERAPQRSARSDEQLFDPAGGRTLDDAIVETLNDASRGDPVACPVCEASGFQDAGGDALVCASCGSRLD
jgi:hypothetical protein